MLDTLRNWMEGGAFIEDDGRPVMFFHGTDVHDEFNIFARFDEQSLGFHFGSAEAANDRLRQIYRMAPPDENEGLLIPVYCRAQNPLRLDDLYTWEHGAVMGALVDAGIVSEEDGEFLEDFDNPEMLFAAIEEAGYDCVVYRNLCEADGHAQDSILVWRAELLKSPYSQDFQIGDPRLLSQNETTEDDIIEWNYSAHEIHQCRWKLQELRRTEHAVAPTL